MRGEIKASWSFSGGKSKVSGLLAAAGLLLSRKPKTHDSFQLVGRLLQPVVDDDVRELRLCLELALGRPQALVDLLGGVCAAADQPSAQRVQRRRRDEHGDRLGKRLTNLAGALDLDLEHHRIARAGSSLEL